MFVNMSSIVSVTRFSDATYNENEKWKDKHGYTFKKRFYNTSIKIKDDIQSNHELIVVEMNITTNKIIAFGLIKNICQQWRYNIYSNNYYNRYTYISSRFMFIEEVSREYHDDIHNLENELFRGKGHMKRGFGIQQVSKKKIKNKEFIKYIYNTILYHAEHDGNSTQPSFDIFKSSFVL